jgi:hypothetical protein
VACGGADVVAGGCDGGSGDAGALVGWLLAERVGWALAGRVPVGWVPVGWVPAGCAAAAGAR